MMKMTRTKYDIHNDNSLTISLKAQFFGSEVRRFTSLR